MITTKRQMALECVKAEHGLVKSPVYAEIRGNLLKTYRRYMRLSRERLFTRCLIALAYNCEVMVKSKLNNKKPRKTMQQLQDEIDELKRMIGEINSRASVFTKLH